MFYILPSIVKSTLIINIGVSKKHSYFEIDLLRMKLKHIFKLHWNPFDIGISTPSSLNYNEQVIDNEKL